MLQQLLVTLLIVSSIPVFGSPAAAADVKTAAEIKRTAAGVAVDARGQVQHGSWVQDSLTAANCSPAQLMELIAQHTGVNLSELQRIIVNYLKSYYCRSVHDFHFARDRGLFPEEPKYVGYPEQVDQSLFLESNDKFIILFPENGKIIELDLKAQAQRTEEYCLPNAAHICSTLVLRDGRLVIGSYSGEVQIWNLVTRTLDKQLVHTVPQDMRGGHYHPDVRALCELPNNRLAIGLRNGFVLLFDMSSDKNIDTGRLFEPIHFLWDAGDCLGVANDSLWMCIDLEKATKQETETDAKKYVHFPKNEHGEFVKADFRTTLQRAGKWTTIQDGLRSRVFENTTQRLALENDLRGVYGIAGFVGIMELQNFGIARATLEEAKPRSHSFSMTTNLQQCRDDLRYQGFETWQKSDDTIVPVQSYLGGRYPLAFDGNKKLIVGLPDGSMEVRVDNDSGPLDKDSEILAAHKSPVLRVLMLRDGSLACFSALRLQKGDGIGTISIWKPLIANDLQGYHHIPTVAGRPVPLAAARSRDAQNPEQPTQGCCSVQ